MKTEFKILKEEHHWTSEEKLKFCGYGEWVEEQDYVNFEYLGYEAQVCRILKIEPFANHTAYFGGYLCGYVRIPEDNPYFGEKDIHLECHGGITSNETHEQHWIGFDCAHSGDYIPTMEHMKRTDPEMIEFRKMFPPPEGYEGFSLFNPQYRNMRYCIKQCKSIIKQLISETYGKKQQQSTKNTQQQ